MSLVIGSFFYAQNYTMKLKEGIKMTNEALERCAEKILNQIAETGDCTTSQLIILRMYNNSLKSKSNGLDDILKYGKQASTLLEKIFPTGGSK